MEQLTRLLKVCLFIVLVLPTLGSYATGAERTKITFGFSSIGAMGTGVWMGKAIGAFEKYGFDADVIYISSGPVVLQALIGGDLHVGVLASNALIAAALNGAPVVAVGSIINKAYHRLWVQPDINRIQDLRGKTLGVTRFGSVTDNLTQMFLRKFGLEQQVKVRQLGGIVEVGAAFQQRLIAGAVTNDLRIDNNVPVKILYRMIDLGVPYSMNMLVVSRDYLRRQPETVERILKAYIEGVAALNGDKETTLKVISQYGRLNDPKKLELHYQDSADYLEKIPRTEPEAVGTLLDFMGKKNTPTGSFVDNSIVDRLVRDGFVERLYKKR